MQGRFFQALDEAEDRIAEARSLASAESSPKVEDGPNAIVKFEVPSTVYRKLRMTAAERGVTIKYLFLELLAQGGYGVDLDQVPTDGRRNR